MGSLVLVSKMVEQHLRNTYGMRESKPVDDHIGMKRPTEPGVGFDLGSTCISIEGLDVWCTKLEL